MIFSLLSTYTWLSDALNLDLILVRAGHPSPIRCLAHEELINVTIIGNIFLSNFREIFHILNNTGSWLK